MKGEVICPFRDKYHYNTLYEVGAVVDFDKERMEDLFTRKLCKKIEGEEETPSPTKGRKGKSKNVEAEKIDDSKKVTKDESVEAEKEQKVEEPDEKTKSEQEAAKKIAEVIGKANE